MDNGAVLARLRSSMAGLSGRDAQTRLAEHGLNRPRSSQEVSFVSALWSRLCNPLNGLLVALALLSWRLSDARSGAVIAVMVLLSVGLGLAQERRSTVAAAKLAKMVRVHASVRRSGRDGPADEGFAEIPLEEVVPGDIVRLAAGDLIPGDVRLLDSKDLYVDQSTLTGEAIPAEKHADLRGEAADDPLACANLCFMGSSVTSGLATAVVVHTGSRTYFGGLAASLAGPEAPTSFDKGLDRFVWLMVGFMLVMTPMVFLINGLTKHDWLQALFFAVAVAVGLAPEMLPMIVTVNLARGAIAMSRRRVIVKRLKAIQNFGAMDVLCTDKTGTLTQGRIILKLHVDIDGHEDEAVLRLGYMNSRFQSGLRNVMDDAILQHAEQQARPLAGEGLRKIDEIPFDFTRRRVSIVAEGPDLRPLMVCKGAVEEVLPICSRVWAGSESRPLDAEALTRAGHTAQRLASQGFRVLAVAARTVPHGQKVFAVADETELTLAGFVAFLDPPKETAAQAIADLRARGVAVKLITGDSDLVACKICQDVGLAVSHVLLGHDLEHMDEKALAEAVEVTQVFAKVTPEQKARLIKALQSNDHVVGFLGDGINDSPALRAADVGISVDTAVDVAKAVADIILLEKSLDVLKDGVLEGRRVFGNIIKYIRMGASSNFGNMLSVTGASVLLPFLPMAPLQVLTNNLLYDLSQTGIPTDRVDEDYLTRPRRWEIGNIARFMLVVGPVSSLFDYATFAVLWWVFHAGHDPALFQTGWFVESLLTQTLIIHVIRTSKASFLESRASPALIATTLTACLVAIWLPTSPLAATLGFKPLPWLFGAVVAAFLVGYAVLAHAAKQFFVRRWGF